MVGFEKCHYFFQNYSKLAVIEYALIVISISKLPNKSSGNLDQNVTETNLFVSRIESNDQVIQTSDPNLLQSSLFTNVDPNDMTRQNPNDSGLPNTTVVGQQQPKEALNNSYQQATGTSECQQPLQVLNYSLEKQKQHHQQNLKPFMDPNQPDQLIRFEADGDSQ